MIDIIGKRNLYYIISAAVLVPGIIALLLWGLPLSIDFTGGSLWELRFNQPTAVLPADLIAIFDQTGLPGASVQTSGADGFLVRSKPMDTETKLQVQNAIQAKYGDFTELRFDSVGPSVGEQTSQRASLAVIIASIAILIYISFAFRKIQKSWMYGICALIALVHDVLVVMGISAILGKLLGWEVDSLFLTALLTVIGFSVHDTIVVFDRIRENFSRMRGYPFEQVVNHSIVQTLNRSINTSLTVVLTLLALTLFGGITIRHFVVTLLIGIISGTYSSIFNASAILVTWQSGEVGRFFRRNIRREEVTA
ncbi:MAG: protein translocase subunit SecF [Chloroflexi bacterium]|nr:protein translocase subunit SecF [Chloroflexota bacterium]